MPLDHKAKIKLISKRLNEVAVGIEQSQIRLRHRPHQLRFQRIDIALVLPARLQTVGLELFSDVRGCLLPARLPNAATIHLGQRLDVLVGEIAPIGFGHPAEPGCRAGVVHDKGGGQRQADDHQQHPLA